MLGLLGLFFIAAAKMILIIIFFIVTYLNSSHGNMITDLSMAPAIATADTVQFFFLESAFPYNCPSNIM